MVSNSFDSSCMENMYPVSCCTPSHLQLLAEKEALASYLKKVFADQNFWCEITLANGLTFSCFGNRNALAFQQTTREGKQAFCLAKRKQTSHQLEAAGKSVVVPHHQILQQEDAELILFSILEGRDIPDAYHLEQVIS